MVVIMFIRVTKLVNNNCIKAEARELELQNTDKRTRVSELVLES